MTSITCRTIVAAFVVVALAASPTRGAIIHESATLGPTGLTGIGWTGVADDYFLGSRFTLTRPVEVAAVGGHLAKLSLDGKFFAAITALTGPTGFPISGTTGLPSMDAFEDWTPLATALFDLPTQSSTDVLVPMSITLGPGDYGLVFGSYLFGATPAAQGTMPANNHGIAGHASFFNYSPFIRTWRDGSGTNLRFVVTGRVIPEPRAWVLALGAVMGLAAAGRRLTPIGRRRSRGGA
jgi:hypothetical protein